MTNPTTPPEVAALERLQEHLRVVSRCTHALLTWGDAMVEIATVKGKELARVRSEAAPAPGTLSVDTTNLPKREPKFSFPPVDEDEQPKAEPDRRDEAWFTMVQGFLKSLDKARRLTEESELEDALDELGDQMESAIELARQPEPKPSDAAADATVLREALALIETRATQQQLVEIRDVAHKALERARAEARQPPEREWRDGFLREKQEAPQAAEQPTDAEIEKLKNEANENCVLRMERDEALDERDSAKGKAEAVLAAVTGMMMDVNQRERLTRGWVLMRLDGIRNGSDTYPKPKPGMRYELVAVPDKAGAPAAENPEIHETEAWQSAPTRSAQKMAHEYFDKWKAAEGKADAVLAAVREKVIKRLSTWLRNREFHPEACDIVQELAEDFAKAGAPAAEKPEDEESPQLKWAHQEILRVNEDRDRLRAALIVCGRTAGGSMADSVSSEFLLHVPAEVKGCIDKLRAEVEAFEERFAVSLAERNRLANERNEARAEVGRLRLLGPRNAHLEQWGNDVEAARLKAENERDAAIARAQEAWRLQMDAEEELGSVIAREKEAVAKLQRIREALQ